MPSVVNTIQRSIQERSEQKPTKPEKEDTGGFPGWFVALLLCCMGGMTVWFIDRYYDVRTSHRIEMDELRNNLNGVILEVSKAESTSHVFTATELEQKYPGRLRAGLIQVLYRLPKATSLEHAPSAVLVGYDLDGHGISYLLVRGEIPSYVVNAP